MNDKTNDEDFIKSLESFKILLNLVQISPTVALVKVGNFENKHPANPTNPVLPIQTFPLIH